MRKFSPVPIPSRPDLVTSKNFCLFKERRKSSTSWLEPISLIIDFSIVRFDQIDLRKLNRSKNIKLIKVEELDSEWSRLSIQFKDYWIIENTEMRIDPSDGSAILSISLNENTIRAFERSKGIPEKYLSSKFRNWKRNEGW